MVRKARGGVTDQGQSRVKVDCDALPAEVTGGPLDIPSQEIAGRRMRDRVDRLREIDDDRAFAPPQDVEG